MAKLDKQKGYGTIIGDTDGKCFEQFGKYFDVDGNEILAKGAKPAPEVKVDAKQEAPKTAVSNQIAAQ